MTVPIDIQPGRLPFFWNRNAIFFANIYSLFFGNDDEMNVLREQIRGVNTYGGRLAAVVNLLFTGGRNHLVLEAPPDESLLEYLSDTLGLCLPRIHIMSEEAYQSMKGVSTFQDVPAEYFDGFVTDMKLEEWARRTGKTTICSGEGSRKGNNKLLLHEFLEQRGIPTFDSHVADRAEDLPAILRDLKNRGYLDAVVKAPIGASGCGMIKLSTSASDPNVPPYLFHEGRCLVQGWLDDTFPATKIIASPSVQLFIHDDRVTAFDMTEQILNSESIHEGNSAPPAFSGHANGSELKATLLELAGIIAEFLYDLNYRGTASIDFVLVQREGRHEIIPCEINARVTGATYPSILARHFRGDGAWLMRNIRFPEPLRGHAIIGRLKRAGLLYEVGADTGVLPFNFNSLESGDVVKSQLVAMGPSLEDCLVILKRACDVFGANWGYDRD